MDDLDRVQQLLKARAPIPKLSVALGAADVDGLCSNGTTLLVTAVQWGRYRAVRWLVEDRKAGVNVCDASGRSPLVAALERGDLFEVSYLASHGADAAPEDVYRHLATVKQPEERDAVIEALRAGVTVHVVRTVLLELRHDGIIEPIVDIIKQYLTAGFT